MFKPYKQLFIVLSCSIVLTACRTPAKPTSQITSIELATGECHGECPHTALYIDSALSYKYFGGKYADKKGYYKGKITQAVWDTLNKKLERVHFKQLDTLYDNSVDDQSLEVIIHFHNTVKHIKAQEASLPGGVADVFYWIAKTYKHAKLVPSKDTIAFTTQVQNQLGPSLPPDVVRFPPPQAKVK